MIRVTLRGKQAIGKHRNFMAKSRTVKQSISAPIQAQEGQGFKAINKSNSKINIEPNKKLDKFINFKL